MQKLIPALAMKKFKEIFHQPLNKFLDANSSAVKKQVVLDIIAFDDWLHEKHGMYEESTPKGMSMRELLTKEYGKDAAEFIESML